MNINPIKTKYTLEAMGHAFSAVLEHKDGIRNITYTYGDKVIYETQIEDGDYWTDDDFIKQIAIDYFAEHKGVVQDLFDNHIDKVVLKEKVATFIMENNGFEIKVIVKETKGQIELLLSTNEGKDVLSGKFSAENTLEALEKLRISNKLMEEISNVLTDNINELSSDRVEEVIKWE